MPKKKKIKKSSFEVGQDVMVTNDFGRFIKGHIVTVLNNEKKGPEYTNEVRDQYGNVGNIPTKYLKAL